MGTAVQIMRERLFPLVSYNQDWSPTLVALKKLFHGWTDKILGHHNRRLTGSHDVTMSDTHGLGTR